jgi:RimJ/RimL family protein N-acetyltransferase
MVTRSTPGEPRVMPPEAAPAAATGSRLVPLSEDHTGALVELLAHERNRLLLSPDLQSRPMAARFIQALGSQQWALPRAWSRDGTWGGICFASDVDLRNLNARVVGIFHDPSTAADCFTSYLRELLWHYPYHRLYATVLSSDDELCALHERAGFISEGVLRDHFLRGERLQDARVFGILRRELFGSAGTAGT